jgi:hypothetical protein
MLSECAGALFTRKREEEDWGKCPAPKPTRLAQTTATSPNFAMLDSAQHDIGSSPVLLDKRVGDVATFAFTTEAVRSA